MSFIGHAMRLGKKNMLKIRFRIIKYYYFNKKYLVMIFQSKIYIFSEFNYKAKPRIRQIWQAIQAVQYILKFTIYPNYLPLFLNF